MSVAWIKAIVKFWCSLSDQKVLVEEWREMLLDLTDEMKLSVSECDFSASFVYISYLIVL